MYIISYLICLYYFRLLELITSYSSLLLIIIIQFENYIILVFENIISTLFTYIIILSIDLSKYMKFY
jgi:hypothetical protein